MPLLLALLRRRRGLGLLLSPLPMRLLLTGCAAGLAPMRLVLHITSSRCCVRGACGRLLLLVLHSGCVPLLQLPFRRRRL